MRLRTCLCLHCTLGHRISIFLLNWRNNRDLWGHLQLYAFHGLLERSRFRRCLLGGCCLAAFHLLGVAFEEVMGGLRVVT